MLTRRREKTTAAQVTVKDEVEVLPDDLDSAADAVQRDAEHARGKAAEHRAEAETVLADAQAAAGRLVEDAQAAARGLSASATAVDRRAAVLEERAGLLRHASATETRADDAEERVADLEAEREQLAARIGGLDRKITGLDGQRQDFAARLEAARGCADLDGIASLRARIEAIGEAVAALNGQRAVAQARVLAIGDGLGAGELLEAVTAAGKFHGELRRILNRLDPSRREAQADEITAILLANAQRIREEAEAASRKPSPAVVRR